MTLHTSNNNKDTISSTSTSLEITEPWTVSNLKDDFSYLLELTRSTLRSHEMIRNHVLRLAQSIADKYFANGMPEYCGQIEPTIKGYLHKYEIFEFDTLIANTFCSQAWKDIKKTLEQSYQRYDIEYNNVLGSKRVAPNPETQEYLNMLDTSLKWAQRNPELVPDEKKRDYISSMDKTRNVMQKEAIQSGVAIYPAETEVEQTRAQTMEKKAVQLRTPKYRIEEVHKMRQEIIKEGLKAVIDVFTQMYEKTINEIPIQSDEEAFMIRDGFLDLANNYVSMDDDKHRMDFAGWAKTLENIKQYGAEKGLKMSGTEITPQDISLIDENTLPIDYYPKYDKIGLSYISKEHLDSKGVIIANCFIDMMNRFAWQESGARLFSYQAKIRGIRAIAVSHKLMGTR